MEPCAAARQRSTAGIGLFLTRSVRKERSMHGWIRVIEEKR
jgi:hypothetical protein